MDRKGNKTLRPSVLTDGMNDVVKCLSKRYFSKNTPCSLVLRRRSLWSLDSPKILRGGAALGTPGILRGAGLLTSEIPMYMSSLGMFPTHVPRSRSKPTSYLCGDACMRRTVSTTGCGLCTVVRLFVRVLFPARLCSRCGSEYEYLEVHEIGVAQGPW